MTANYENPDPTGILEGHADSENYSPDQEEMELASCLKERFEGADNGRGNWEYNANYHRLWLQGNQVVLRSRSTGETFRASLSFDDSRRLSSTDNIIRTTGRALVGKLSRIIPQWAVLPRTNDQSDLRAAVVAESFLDYVFRKCNLRKKYVRANKHLLWAGTSFWQVAWDKEAGRQISWCQQCDYTGDHDEAGQECPQCQMAAEQQAEQANAQAQMQAQQQAQMAMVTGQPPPSPPQAVEPQQAPQLVLTREGDIVVHNHDPRDVYPEPGVTEIEDMRWICIRKAIPVSTVREMFPEKAKYIAQEDGIYTDRVLGMHSTVNDTRSEVQYLEDHVYLYEFHERATTIHPKGRVIYMCNDIILSEQESPYHMLDRVPFYVWRFETNDGDFWGESFIEQAAHIQKERNKLLSQMRTQRELTNNPQKLVPIMSRISLSEWDDQPGRQLVYNPMGGKPQYLEQPQFPNYVYNELERMQGAIQDKASVTDQELGRTVSDTSGRYAAITEAQTSESIQPIMVENGSEWLQIGRAILQLAQAYYSSERVWTVQGQDRVLSFAWDEMNLKSGWDVMLSEEDSLSKNPALRLQQAQGLLQNGVFTDQQTGMPDMRKFMRVAQLKMPGTGPDLRESERAYAAQIPHRLMRGQGFEPSPEDDVEVMTEELLAWLRGDGRNADPMLRQQVRQIWMAYAQIFAQTATPMDRSMMPSPMGQQQQPQQQGGGQGGMGAGAMPQPQSGQPMQGQAQQSVRQADQQAEAQARTQDRQES